MKPRAATIAAFSLFAIALAITTVRAVTRVDSQFTGADAFVSADVATTARTFATEGVWKLHGVPVNNNPPIRSEDSYVHWPPLLPILLSGCYRLFGASERTTHVFMLCILLSTALLISRLGWLWLGPIGGALAGYFWLTLPVVVQFGDLVAQQSLAMLLIVSGLVAFYSGREKLGAVFFFFAVFSAWEAVLVIPGIWFASEHRKVAVAAIAAGFVCVVGLFVLGSSAAADTLQTVKYYMGLSPVYSHTLPHDRAELGFAQQISGILWNHLWMLGVLGSAAILQLLANRPKALLVPVLAAPWLLWTVLMRTHVAIHPFELLIAAPLAALALAWVATAEVSLKTGGFVVLAALQLLVLPRIAPDRNAGMLIRYAHGIRGSTPPGSIVMAPLLSAIPLYYSERHIVRGIASEHELSEKLAGIRRDFPGSPVYLAIPPFLASDFDLSHVIIVSSTDDVIIARL